MWPRKRSISLRKSCSPGITLIEMVVVTTILAMAAAAIVVIFQPLLAKSQYEGFIGRLKEIDDLTRRTAHINSKDLKIEFDLSLQMISYSRWNAGSPYQTSLKVPRGIQLGEILGGYSDSGTKIIIPIRSGGYSNNYGIRIDSNGEQNWLLFFGGSGEVKQVEHENQMQAIFSGS